MRLSLRRSMSWRIGCVCHSSLRRRPPSAGDCALLVASLHPSPRRLQVTTRNVAERPHQMLWGCWQISSLTAGPFAWAENRSLHLIAWERKAHFRCDLLTSYMRWVRTGHTDSRVFRGCFIPVSRIFTPVSQISHRLIHLIHIVSR